MPSCWGEMPLWEALPRTVEDAQEVDFDIRCVRATAPSPGGAKRISMSRDSRLMPKLGRPETRASANERATARGDELARARSDAPGRGRVRRRSRMMRRGHAAAPPSSPRSSR
jgi:hypothetical protein